MSIADNTAASFERITTLPAVADNTSPTAIDASPYTSKTEDAAVTFDVPPTNVLASPLTPSVRLSLSMLTLDAMYAFRLSAKNAISLPDAKDTRSPATIEMLVETSSIVLAELTPTCPAERSDASTFPAADESDSPADDDVISAESPPRRPTAADTAWRLVVASSDIEAVVICMLDPENIDASRFALMLASWPAVSVTESTAPTLTLDPDVTLVRPITASTPSFTVMPTL